MALAPKTIHKVSTKLEKGADEKSTTLTLDWTGVTDEQLQAIATRQVIVTRQGKYRRDEDIPAVDTFAVRDYGTSAPEPVNVDTTFARATALTEAEQREMIARLTANLKPASGGGAAPKTPKSAKA